MLHHQSRQKTLTLPQQVAGHVTKIHNTHILMTVALDPIKSLGFHLPANIHEYSPIFKIHNSHALPLNCHDKNNCRPNSRVNSKLVKNQIKSFCTHQIENISDITYISAVQPAARGPHAARGLIQSGPPLALRLLKYFETLKLLQRNFRSVK